MSVFGLWKGRSWAGLPAVRRKWDSGDDRSLQLIRTQQASTTEHRAEREARTAKSSLC